MRTWRSLFLYLVCLPSDIIGFSVVLIARLFGGKKLKFEKRPTEYPDGRPAPGNWVLTCDLKDGFCTSWHYSAITVSPHAILYRQFVRDNDLFGWSRIQEHEHCHSEQFEGAGLIGFTMSLVMLIFGVYFVVPLIVWTVFPWIPMGSSYATSWLRGEDFYRGASIEEGARGADDYYDNPWNL